MTDKSGGVFGIKRVEARYWAKYPVNPEKPPQQTYEASKIPKVHEKPNRKMQAGISTLPMTQGCGRRQHYQLSLPSWEQSLLPGKLKLPLDYSCLSNKRILK